MDLNQIVKRNNITLSAATFLSLFLVMLFILRRRGA